MSKMKKDSVNKIKEELREEIVSTWDAIADIGECDLIDAWNELDEKK